MFREYLTHVFYPMGELGLAILCWNGRINFSFFHDLSSNALRLLGHQVLGPVRSIKQGPMPCRRPHYLEPFTLVFLGRQP